MSSYQNDDTIITDYRIKQTLKNLIKDDFLQKYHIHPADRKTALKAAQKHLSFYCKIRLEDQKFSAVLCHKILLDTYYVTEELQERYCEEYFKEIVERRIDILWPQLKQLHLADWEEYTIDPHLLDKTVWETLFSPLQFILLWFIDIK